MRILKYILFILCISPIVFAQNVRVVKVGQDTAAATSNNKTIDKAATKTNVIPKKTSQIQINKPNTPSSKLEKKEDTTNVKMIGKSRVIVAAPKKVDSSVFHKPNNKTTIPVSGPKEFATPAPKTTNFGAKPSVRVEIRMNNKNVSSLSDALVYITIYNSTRFAQSILFDKPFRPGIGPWGTEVFLSRNNQNIVKESHKPDQHPKNFHDDFLVKSKSNLEANGWILKVYPLSDLFTAEGNIEHSKALQSGNYTLQISYMGIMSNAIDFNVR